jgi:arylsulfatase A-like enzyme
MRIIYFDIDTLRADHLSCFGYHRKTSPVIDQVAREGIRYTNCYASDAPCLPSRTALLSGRFGIHNGVVGHGGTAADLFVEGKNRWFSSTLGETSWMSRFRKKGYRTVTISSFGERHSAWQSDMMRSATHARDPLWHVLMEGGPLHTRDNVSTYIRRLMQTGREDQAKILQLKHPEVKVKKKPPDKEEETYDIPDIV